MTANDIVRIARGFLGARFRHQGRSLQEGLDCLGLLFAVAHKAGLTFNDQHVFALDVRSYGSKPDADFLQAKLEANLVRTDAAAMDVADILLMRIDGRAQHLALLSDHAHGFGMIHAYAPARKVVEHRLSYDWVERIEAAYRLPQLN